MDFDSPGAAQKAVAALKASGVQAQMAKVCLIVVIRVLCTVQRPGVQQAKKNGLCDLFI